MSHCSQFTFFPTSSQKTHRSDFSHPRINFTWLKFTLMKLYCMHTFVYDFFCSSCFWDSSTLFHYFYFCVTFHCNNIQFIYSFISCRHGVVSSFLAFISKDAMNINAEDFICKVINFTYPFFQKLHSLCFYI